LWGDAGRVYQTNQIPDTQTQGTASSICSSIYMGNFRRLYYGSRLEFNLRVMKEKYSLNWPVGLLLSLGGTWIPLHETSFAKIYDILGEITHKHIDLYRAV